MHNKIFKYLLLHFIMQVIGFNLTKMSGEKLQEIVAARPNTSIEFTNLQKEKFELLKDSEAIKISFKYSVAYEDSERKKDTPQSNILIEGHIVLSVSKDESKEITKAWKKKKLPPNLNLHLFNLILRRCTPKAIFLEDEIALPFHTPMPRLSPKKE